MPRKPLTQLLAASLRYPDPDQQLRFVAERIASAVASSRLRLFDAAQPAAPDRVVVVVAPYVNAELELLDAIDDALATLPDQIVEIADVRTIESIEQFRAIAPGIGRVPRTPVMAVWVGGGIHETAWGNDALERLRKRYSRP